MTANDILTFWLEKLTPQDWFKKSNTLDNEIKKRFADTLEAACRGECWQWRTTAKGRLAEIIVLDQFSRNMHRETPRAFSQDPMALALAQEAVKQEADKSLNADEKAFLYMPYMHSESRLIHEQAMMLFDQSGLEESYKYEVKHKEIIDRFGRYPHRNAAMGRESTDDELEFLKQPGSSF